VLYVSIAGLLGHQKSKRQAYKFTSLLPQCCSHIVEWYCTNGSNKVIWLYYLIYKKKGIADEIQNDNCNAALLNVSVSGAFHL